MNTEATCVFVVGMPRSGTKLLRDLLNRHSRVAIPEAETEFLPWLYAWVAANGEPVSPDRFNRLWQRIKQQQYFHFRAEAGHPIDPASWHAACSSYDAGGLFEALVRVDTGTAGGDAIWGDKSPSYVNDLALIDRIFPHARVVHIVRDVRDQCASMRLAWGKHVLRAAQDWVDGIASARADGAALGVRYLEVRYEDLLDDAEAVLRRVCQHLGLLFEPQMLVLQRAPENLGRTQGSLQVVRGNRGRFGEVLSAAEVSAIERIAGPTLKALGYPADRSEPEAHRLTRFRLALYRVHDAVNLLRFERRQRGWLGAALFHWRRYRAVHHSGVT